MLFDSHAHLIADDDFRYPPAPLSGKLRDGDLDERFTAERMLDLMDEAGVTRICAVQRAHVYGYDNRYVIDAARRYPDRMLAVVAIDAASPNAAETVRRWMGEGAAGIRMAALNPQVSDTDWFASASAMKVWEEAEKTGASICLHVFRPLRRQALQDLAPLLDRFSSIKVVVDHVANTAFDGGPPDHGVDDALSALKDKANLFFKLTTINLRRTREAGHDTAPVVARLVQVLGAQKIMWGSDIGQTKGTYPEMAGLLKEASAGLAPPDREAIFNGSWSAVYGAGAI